MTSIYCSRCGTSNDADSAFCRKCGVQLQPGPMPAVYSYYGHRHHWHEGRSDGPHLGGLIAGVLIIVVGLGIFFPELPTQWFWASVLILLGSWIVFFWTQEISGYSSQRTSKAQRQ